MYGAIDKVRGELDELARLREENAQLRAALATVARHDGFTLCWERSCSCDLCEGDRLVARCLGRAHSTDGIPIELAPPDWMTGEEARLRAAIERHIEQAARDDYNATHLGDVAAPPWAGLTDAGRAVYRQAVSDDFWREG